MGERRPQLRSEIACTAMRHVPPHLGAQVSPHYHPTDCGYKNENVAMTCFPQHPACGPQLPGGKNRKQTTLGMQHQWSSTTISSKNSLGHNLVFLMMTQVRLSEGVGQTCRPPEISGRRRPPCPLLVHAYGCMSV